MDFSFGNYSNGVFYRYVEMAFQKKKSLLKLIDIMIFTTIAVVIAVYIYRMIFWYPNKEPMVYDKIIC